MKANILVSMAAYKSWHATRRTCQAVGLEETSRRALLAAFINIYDMEALRSAAVPCYNTDIHIHIYLYLKRNNKRKVRHLNPPAALLSGQCQATQTHKLCIKKFNVQLDFDCVF